MFLPGVKALITVCTWQLIVHDSVITIVLLGRSSSFFWLKWKLSSQYLMRVTLTNNQHSRWPGCWGTAEKRGFLPFSQNQILFWALWDPMSRFWRYNILFCLTCLWAAQEPITTHWHTHKRQTEWPITVQPGQWPGLERKKLPLLPPR